MTADDRIQQALTVAVRWGGFDEGHHKAWVIDQIVRALTGCTFADDVAVGTSAEYLEFVIEAKAGYDGPESYGWDEGIPP